MIKPSTIRRRRPDQGGFTLIELLVVIIILGVLSAVVVFAVRGVSDKGQGAATSIDAKTVRTAEEAFCAKFGRYGSMEELVDPPDGGRGFLSEPSTQTAIETGDGGKCGTGPMSSYSTSNSQAEIKIAGPEDNWPDDPGRGVKSSAFGYPLNLNVYEPLIYVNSDYTFRGGLAESWELIPKGDPRKPTRPYDNDTWRFKLRQGVKFHDGSAFDAEDVMWTWHIRQAKGKTLTTVVNTLGFDPAFPDGSETPKLNSVEKIDDFTVDFTPRIANLRLPEQIVHPEGAIVRRGHHFDDPSGPTGGWGTGPFKVAGYTERASAAVERFDGYWDQTRAAKVKRMNVTFFPDATQRANALLSGQFDLAIDLPAESTTTAQGQGLRVVRSRQEGRNQMIMVNKVGNAGFAETADRNVRQAISKAIDRTDYVNTVFGPGNAAPGRYMSPPGALGSFANLVAQPTMNQAEARSLLAASGYVCVGSQAPSCNPDEIRQKDGKPLKLVMFGIVDTSPTTYSFLAGKLKAIGIDTDIHSFATTPPRSAFYQANVNAPQWHLNIESPNQNDGNPAFFPYLRFYGKLPGNPPGSYRFAPCIDGITYTTNLPCAFDDWGDRSNVASPTTAVSVQEASAQMQKILVNDEAIAIPLAGRYRIMGMKSSLNLTDPHPSNTNQQWITLTQAA